MANVTRLWIPVASFVLAVLLSLLGAPPERALARRFADPTGITTCVDDLKTLRGRAKTTDLRIDPLLPALSTGKIRTRSVVNFQGGFIYQGEPQKTDNYLWFKSELRLPVNGSGPDGNPISGTLPVEIPPLDGGLEIFHHTGVQWEHKVETQFHEEGRDLARLAKALLQQHHHIGEDYFYNPDIQLYFVLQSVLSDTWVTPRHPPIPPCSSDEIQLVLVLSTIGGSGRAEDIQPN
jgi:hypothetical protein